METNNTNAEPYSPKTLQSLLSGINCILKANKVPFSIFDKEDPVFCNLMFTMNSMSSDLHSKSIGTKQRSAEVTSIYFGLKDHLAVDHHKCSSRLSSFT